MKYEMILLDMEAQRDFFSRGGSCHTRNSSSVAGRIYDLFKWARQLQIPVMSTVIRLRPGKVSVLSQTPHCIEGTDGERKLARTILPNRVDLGIRNTTDLPPDIFDRYRQVIFEMRSPDIFAHARPERLISQLKAATFVLCGAGFAGGIVEAAIGLRNRGFAVIVASDAVLDLEGDIPMARSRAEVKGTLFLTTDRIIATHSPAIHPTARRRARSAERVRANK